MTNSYTLEKTPQLPSRHLSFPSPPCQSPVHSPHIIFSHGGQCGVFSFFCHSLFLALFFPRLQCGVLHRPPYSQRCSSSWVSTCAGIPACCTGLAFFSSVSCPNLKPVARSYPKPNHSLSAVKNVVPQAPLSPAKSFPGLVCTVSVLVSAEKGGKLSSERRKNRPLNFTPVPGYACCSQGMSCEVRLEAIGFEGTAERHCAHMWMP